MERLNDILHELGISKVKLAKFLGVSRQMIYNYLDLDDINKWPKDKKVMLLNLLGIKSADELDSIKVDTDYIMDVEARLNNIFTQNQSEAYNETTLYKGLNKKQKEVMHNIIDIMKERLEEDKDDVEYNTFKYLYHFLQALSSAKELKYILAYISKSLGNTSATDFVFNEDDQYIFESIMFSAMTLYHGGGANRVKIEETHKRFVKQVESKIEDKLSRTFELNTIKVQALKELGYTDLTTSNGSEVFAKIAEIESRKLSD